MRLRIVPMLLLTVSLSTGCRDAKIASYRVPKEVPEALPPVLTGELPAASKASAAAPDMASTPVVTATGDGLTWTAPERWRAKPSSAMRKGSYAIPGGDTGDADLSITAFPGDVGGNLANVNRWRGQIELGPLKQEELETVTTHLDRNGLHIDLVEFANSGAAKPQRIIGAIVPFGNATWFFKLMGPDSVVAAEKETFVAFLETIKAPAAGSR